MIYQFKVNDIVYKKLMEYSKDKSVNVNHELAGNIENEFSLNSYKKEFEPFILSQLDKIEPLKKYFIEDLNILVPTGLPLTLGSLWVNHQKKYEFNPMHTHSGVFSFIIFLKIPYTKEEQSFMSPGKKSNRDRAGKLSFFYLNSDIDGGIGEEVLDVDKNWEKKGLIFKSNLNHCVYPFYTDGERITVSGNLFFNREVNNSI